MKAQICEGFDVKELCSSVWRLVFLLPTFLFPFLHSRGKNDVGLVETRWKKISWAKYSFRLVCYSMQKYRMARILFLVPLKLIFQTLWGCLQGVEPLKEGCNWTGIRCHRRHRSIYSAAFSNTNALFGLRWRTYLVFPKSWEKKSNDDVDSLCHQKKGGQITTTQKTLISKSAQLALH
jgi:hypothetical protein